MIKKTPIVILIFFLFLNCKVNSQINKLTITEFLNTVISKKDFNISEFENSIVNSRDNSLLLNKAARFKVYIRTQNHLTKLYSEKCTNNSTQISIKNLIINNTFLKGISNSNYLLEIAEAKDPSFKKEFKETFNREIKKLTSLLKFTEEDCLSTLASFSLREKGFFTDDNLRGNVLSFNYINNPVDELLNGYDQEFSSLDSSKRDFYITLKLPRSWKKNNKTSYNSDSTVAIFQPYENFLNGIVSVSISKSSIVSQEDMTAQKITDNDILDEIYDNNELLLSTLKNLTKNLVNQKKINTSIYSNGNKKLLFYVSKNNLSKITGNQLLNKQEFQSWNVITFHQGKLIKLDFAATNEQGDLNSFDYYSKVFFKIITSIKFKNIP